MDEKSAREKEREFRSVDCSDDNYFELGPRVRESPLPSSNDIVVSNGFGTKLDRGERRRNLKNVKEG